MSSLIFVPILVALSPLPFLFVTSQAIFCGISAARDEHHRMTPQSPWFFFRQEVPKHYLSACFSVLLILGGLIAIIILTKLNSPIDIGKAGLWQSIIILTDYMVILAGYICASLYFILLYAPGFKSSKSLFVSSSLIGILYLLLVIIATIGSVFLNERFFAIEVTAPVTEGPAGNGTIYSQPWLHFAMGAFMAIMLGVRIYNVLKRKPDHWFFAASL